MKIFRLKKKEKTFDSLYNKILKAKEKKAKKILKRNRQELATLIHNENDFLKLLILLKPDLQKSLIDDLKDTFSNWFKDVNQFALWAKKAKKHKTIEPNILTAILAHKKSKLFVKLNKQPIAKIKPECLIIFIKIIPLNLQIAYLTRHKKSFVSYCAKKDKNATIAQIYRSVHMKNKKLLIQNFADLFPKLITTDKIFAQLLTQMRNTTLRYYFFNTIKPHLTHLRLTSGAYLLKILKRLDQPKTNAFFRKIQITLKNIKAYRISTFLDILNTLDTTQRRFFLLYSEKIKINLSQQKRTKLMTTCAYSKKLEQHLNLLLSQHSEILSGYKKAIHHAPYLFKHPSLGTFLLKKLSRYHSKQKAKILNHLSSLLPQSIDSKHTLLCYINQAIIASQTNTSTKRKPYLTPRPSSQPPQSIHRKRRLNALKLV